MLFNLNTYPSILDLWLSKECRLHLLFFLLLGMASTKECSLELQPKKEMDEHSFYISIKLYHEKKKGGGWSRREDKGKITVQGSQWPIANHNPITGLVWLAGPELPVPMGWCLLRKKVLQTTLPTFQLHSRTEKKTKPATVPCFLADTRKKHDAFICISCKEHQPMVPRG